MGLISNAALCETLSELSIVKDGVIELYDSIDSTSTRLAELAAEGAPSGSLVVARRQAKGRGRRGRSFSSPEGGLYFSLLLRHDEMAVDAPTSLIAGLACSQAIDEVARVATYLKWPNDILLNDKKVGGILAEAGKDQVGPRYILGVGLNINTPLSKIPFMLRGTATSVALETGYEEDLDEVLRASLSWLQGHLLLRSEAKGSLLIGQVSDRMPLIGTRVRATVGGQTVEGTAMALSNRGNLLVLTPNGKVSVSAGDVEQLR